jgi:Domain of unknown function (DUF4417)
MTADDWGIPTLDLSWACTTPILGGLPGWHGWGDNTRKERALGRGVHFYKDDYKFIGLHRNPDRLVRFGCPACVEPNYSTWPGMPRAIALADIYRKRSLAYSWGQAGIKILADLNVHDSFADLMLLGIPPGWPGYAIRWNRDGGMGRIQARIDRARHRAGHEPTVLVFGGGPSAKRACREAGLTWISTQRTNRDGRAQDQECRIPALEGITSVHL